jgi:hypothetical protein
MWVEDIEKLQDAAREYRDLVDLRRHELHERGQQAPLLMAKALDAYGIETSIVEDGLGNNDVLFSLRDKRHLLRAIWRNLPTDARDIARFEQYLDREVDGAVGVIVSFNGFAADATGGTTSNDHRTILMSYAHVETLLSGVSTPGELFLGARDAAVRLVGALSEPMECLLQSKPEPPLDPIWGPDLAFGEFVLATSPEVTADVVLSNLPSGRIGISARSQTQFVLVTTFGTFDVDLERQTLRTQIVPSDLHSPVTLTSGEQLAVRLAGIWNITSARAHALIGNGELVPMLDFGGFPWVLCGGPAQDPASLVRLGQGPGDELSVTLDASGGPLIDAAWATNDSVVVTDGDTLSLIAPTGKVSRLGGKLTNVRSLLSNERDAVIAVADESSDSIQVLSLGVNQEQQRTLVSLRLSPSVSEASTVPSDATTFFLTGNYRVADMHHSAVLRIKSALPASETVDGHRSDPSVARRWGLVGFTQDENNKLRDILLSENNEVLSWESYSTSGADTETWMTDKQSFILLCDSFAISVNTLEQASFVGTVLSTASSRAGRESLTIAIVSARSVEPLLQMGGQQELELLKSLRNRGNFLLYHRFEELEAELRSRR